MAVQAPVNPKMHMDTDDDDDEPLVFKRTSTSSKQSHSGQETKKSSSQRHNGPSGRQVSDVRSPNGVNSSIQKNKNVSSTVTAPVKPPLASSNATAKASSSKVSNAGPNALMSPGRRSPSPSKSPIASSKPAEGQPKQTLKQMSNSVKEEDKSTEWRTELKSHADDSDDDKPLIARVKGNPVHANKEPSASAPDLSCEDSDDDKPLSARLPMKSTAGGSVSNVKKKPLASKALQAGSVAKNSILKSPPSSSKRPLDKCTASSSQSAVKKAKPSDSSTMKPAVVKRQVKEEEDDDDSVPIAQRIKKAAGSAKKAASAKQNSLKPVKSSFKKPVKSNKVKKESGYSKLQNVPESWSDGQKKWTTLVHNGVIFPPPYKPHGVKMLYKGRPVDLTPEQEEVATMFAVMKDTDYMEKDRFKQNFWSDWRKLLGKNHVIQSLEGCDFTPIYEWAQQEKEKKKQMSKEEKAAIREAKMKEEDKYMWAIVDGVKEKVGNFRVEPPGLFRGRGEHPKMGMLKRRIHPSDITINIGKDAPIPECPITGESWKEIRHDNTVTWLAFWQNPINPREFKYVFLAASSSLKGQSDKEKYEKARMLKGYIDNIRANYAKDFATKDITKRQIAVATYLIDKLALRAGNEKDDDEADTVGCCTLKVENVTPVPPSTLKFDFLGKDSIRYVNDVEVLPPVYKAIEQFRSGKNNGDDLFDKLNTSTLNAHLKELMPGLTAKVFRTFNASYTLDEKLSTETKGKDVTEKIADYNRANKLVAVICNHQRTVSKSHGAQMAKLNEKIEELKVVLNELKTDLARAKKGKPPLKDADGKQKRNLSPESLEKKVNQTTEKIAKMVHQKEIKEDLKTVALGTSKINYCDPRITVAWCKRHEVPIEKIFQKTLLAKFAWAMDTDPDFRF